MSEPVRARYTYHPVTAVLGLLLALPIVAPIVWWKSGIGLPGWAVPLIVLVAAPLTWAWTLFRLVYRLELTDTQLRLRAPLSTTNVALTDLREVSTSPNGHSLGRVVHGRGRKRALLAGMGLMEFLDQARTAAPQARIAVSGFSHAEERLGRLFHQGRSDGR